MSYNVCLLEIYTWSIFEQGDPIHSDFCRCAKTVNSSSLYF